MTEISGVSRLLCPTSNALHELIDGFPVGDVPQPEEERLEVVFFLFGVEVLHVIQHIVSPLLAEVVLS
jgi:hypothetical protein